MKKIILLFFLIPLFLIPVNIFSQAYVEQYSGVTVNLTSASICQIIYSYPQVAWICGYNGTVLRTTNIGLNWVNVSGNGVPTNVNLVNIFCIDVNTSLTAGNIGTTSYVYRTSNAGANWVQVFSQANGKINAIWMKNTTQGFMCGDPVNGRWSLWKTSNGGLNWDSSGMYLARAGSETGFNNSLSRVGNRLWFGTNNTRIYFSTNFGTNWQIISTAPEVNSYAVHFYYFDSTCGYFGGTNSYKTTNSGMNWTLMTCPGSGNFAAFVNAMPGVYQGFPPMWDFAIRNDSNLYSNNMMGNWYKVYSAPAGIYRYAAPAYPPNLPSVSWAVRSNGGITRFAIFSGGIKKISSDIPESFSLSQNYPNPFNPTTKIKYDITKNCRVELKVYDATGHQIAQLVNEQQTPGTYEADFDGSAYASGVYFYKLMIGNDASTRLSITKRMVMIK